LQQLGSAEAGDQNDGVEVAINGEHASCFGTNNSAMEVAASMSTISPKVAAGNREVLQESCSPRRVCVADTDVETAVRGHTPATFWQLQRSTEGAQGGKGSLLGLQVRTGLCCI
jgi:hypothetical protein